MMTLHPTKDVMKSETHGKALVDQSTTNGLRLYLFLLIVFAVSG